MIFEVCSNIHDALIMSGDDYYAPTQTFDDVDVGDNNDDDDSDTSPVSEERPWAMLIRTNDGKEFRLGEGVSTIGRDKNATVFIPGKVLSRIHAEIELTSRVFSICDKNSRNRTKRGKVTLVPNVRYELQDGDVISFGNVRCSFKALRRLDEEEDEEEEMSLALSDGEEEGEDEEDEPTQKIDDGNDVIPETCVFDEDIPATCVFDDEIPATCVFDDNDGTPNDENANLTPTKRKKTDFSPVDKNGQNTDCDSDNDSDSDEEFLKATQAAISEGSQGSQVSAARDTRPPANIFCFRIPSSVDICW